MIDYLVPAHSCRWAGTTGTQDDKHIGLHWW
jgi:hypothetical protein